VDRLESLAARIRQLREAAGLSMDALATKAGVPMPTLRNWEQAKREPGVFAIEQLAAALGVSISELLSGPDPSLNPEPIKRGPKKADPTPEDKPTGRRAGRPRKNI